MFKALSLLAHPKAARWVPWAMVVVVIAIFGYRYAGPIWDIDTGWHLATGGWIVEHRAIPDRDPFGVYGQIAGVPAQVILKGYWLAQTIMHTFLSAWGPAGVIALRVLILAACLAVLVVRARRLGAAWPVVAVVLALVGASLSSYTGDRPNLFSFLLASLTFWWLEQHTPKQQGWLAWIGFAALGAAWGNLHGGWVLSVVLLWLYVAVRLVSDWRKNGEACFRPLIGAGVFSLGVLMSPAGLLTIQAALAIQFGQMSGGHRSTEYITTLQARTIHDSLLPVWVLSYYFLAVAAFPALWRVYPERALGLLVLCVFSLFAARYHPFFLMVGGPWIAQGLTLAWRNLERDTGWAERRRIVGGVCVVAATGVWGTALAGMPEMVRPGHALAPKTFQGELARFSGLLQGRKIFNHMNYGGFLLWLAPGARPFIDGRGLNPQRLARYTHILWHTPEGKYWLESEGFDAVVIPEWNSSTGQRYTLPAYLISTGRWSLALRENGYIVMLRNR